MAKAVVDRLEVVDVGDKKPETPAVARQVLNSAGQCGIEQAAVGQASQRIVEG